MNGTETKSGAHARTAALIGGAAAVTAGAVWGARFVARRNGVADATALNPVMKTALTACELARNEGSNGPQSGRASVQRSTSAAKRSD